MTHPSDGTLALFAGRDLGLWQSWTVRRHLARCARCHQEVEAYRQARREFASAAGDMPDDVNWNRLASEMKANIHVGLAAGECVGPSEEPARFVWRLAWTVVPVLLLLLAGWWLQPSRPRLASLPQQEGIVLEATAKGIELRDQGRALSLQHPGAGDVTYLVNAQGTLRARYVDSETGQVTINNVYAQ